MAQNLSTQEYAGVGDIITVPFPQGTWAGLLVSNYGPFSLYWTIGADEGILQAYTQDILICGVGAKNAKFSPEGINIAGTSGLGTSGQVTLTALDPDDLQAYQAASAYPTALSIPVAQTVVTVVVNNGNTAPAQPDVPYKTLVPEARYCVINVVDAGTIVPAPGVYNAIRIIRAEVVPDDATGTPYLETSDGAVILGMASLGQPHDSQWTQNPQILAENTSIKYYMGGASKASFAVHCQTVTRAVVPAPPTLPTIAFLFATYHVGGARLGIIYKISETGATLASYTTGDFIPAGVPCQYAAMSRDGKYIAGFGSGPDVHTDAPGIYILRTADLGLHTYINVSPAGGGANWLEWDDSGNIYIVNQSGTGIYKYTAEGVLLASENLAASILSVRAIDSSLILMGGPLNTVCLRQSDLSEIWTNNAYNDYFIAGTDSDSTVLVVDNGDDTALLDPANGDATPITVGNAAGIICAGVIAGIMYQSIGSELLPVELPGNVSLPAASLVPAGFQVGGIGSIPISLIDSDNQSVLAVIYGIADSVVYLVAGNTDGVLSAPVRTALAPGTIVGQVFSTHYASPQNGS